MDETWLEQYHQKVKEDNEKLKKSFKKSLRLLTATGDVFPQKLYGVQYSAPFTVVFERL